MATNHSTTELTNTIPEIWDMNVLKYRYYYGKVTSKVLNKSDLVKEKGDKINITLDTVLTGGDVGTSGAFTLLARTPGTVQIAVDKWKYAGVEVTDQAKIQSFWTPESSLPHDAGKLFAQYQDTDLLALYSSLTGGTVNDETAPKAFGTESAKEALLIFSNTDIPMEDIFFVIPPSAVFRGLLAERAFTDVSWSGKEGKSPLMSGDYLLPIVGTPLVMSNLVATAAGGGVQSRKAMLLHKEALGVAMQMNNKYRKYDAASAGRLAEGAIAETMYGVKVVRADHGVVINVI